MPRPFVVVVSGNTHIILPGLDCVRCARETRFFLDVGAGCRDGGEKASRMAEKRVMRSTWRVEG